MLTVQNNRDIFNQRIQKIIKSNENRTNEVNAIGLKDVELILRYQSDINGNIKCIHCGSIIDIYTMELDHLTPVSKGGTTKLGNVFASCKTCNRSKHDKDFKEFHNNDTTKIMRIMELVICITTKTCEQLEKEINVEKPLIIKQNTIEEFYEEVENEKNQLEIYKAELQEKEQNIDKLIDFRLKEYTEKLDTKFKQRVDQLEKSYIEKMKELGLINEETESILKRGEEPELILNNSYHKSLIELKKIEKRIEYKKKEHSRIMAVFQESVDNEQEKLKCLRMDYDSLLFALKTLASNNEEELKKMNYKDIINTTVRRVREANALKYTTEEITNKEEKITSLKKRIKEYKHMPKISEKYEKQLEELMRC